MNASPIVSLSQVDEERFGIKTARTSLVTNESLPEILAFCRENEVTFLIARCPTTDLKAVHEMEKSGFRLMDTLVYYERNLVKKAIPQDPGETLVRLSTPDEGEAVRVVAAESLEGYFGHYHADPRLDPAKCDEAYVDWAVRSVTSRQIADDVLVAEVDGKIAGFATLRLNNSSEGEGVLFAVAPWAQRRGIYNSFIIKGMEWCLSKGTSSMVVSTQITNIAVQKVWVRLGFELNRAYYTFHGWFDTP
jgi:hypothetical protein